MASRAPLLVAAALFFIGVAGLLATVPGREVSGDFVPLVRGGSHSSTQAPPEFVPTIPDLSFSVPTSAGEQARVDAATPAPPTATPFPPTPTPVLHSAVVAAVASDVSPTPSAPRPVMISSDGEDDETPTPSATPEPSATATNTPTAEPTSSPEP